MRTQVKYEWTLETLEDGDIVDSDFSDTLSFDHEDLVGKDLGLIRAEGNEIDGTTEMFWAYVKNGMLPEYFCNEIGNATSIKVPQRFHNELKQYLND